MPILLLYINKSNNIAMGYCNEHRLMIVNIKPSFSFAEVSQMLHIMISERQSFNQHLL